MSAARLRVAVLAGAGALALAGVAAGLNVRGGDPVGGESDPELETAVLMATIDELEARLVLDPLNPVVGNVLIRDHLAAFGVDNELLHLRRAEEIAETLVPVALNRGSAYAALAATRLTRHDFSGAYAAAELSVADDSTGEAGLGTMFDAAVAAGRYERAEWALGSLLTHHRDAMATVVREARWLAALGEPSEAVDRLAPACRRIEGRAVRRRLVAWCDVVLGGLARESHGPGASSSLYVKALRTQPGYGPAIEGLAGNAYAEGRWEDARRLYLEIESDAHPDLQLRLAEIARALGREAEASEREAEFLRLTETDEARALHAHQLAIFLAERPETRDAALEVISADMERRRSVEAYETLAWVRWRRGELDEALTASDSSRTWGAPSATNDYLRARILEDVRRSDRSHVPEAVRRELAALAVEAADPAMLDPHAARDLRGRMTATRGSTG